MGMPSRHNDGFALVQLVGVPVNRNLPHSLQAGNKRVAAGFMRTDLFVLIKRKQRHADRVILGQRPAGFFPFAGGGACPCLVRHSDVQTPERSFRPDQG